MRVQTSANNRTNQLSMRAGLYFTKVPNVLFNRSSKIRYITEDVVNVSAQGFRYIEDRTVPREIKEKFSFVPFVRELAEKFDTFVFFRELPKGHPNNITGTYFSFSRIKWFDYSKDKPSERVVDGNSNVSQESATRKMFDNLLHNNFVNFRII